jgi:hypothetical protein
MHVYITSENAAGEGRRSFEDIGEVKEEDTSNGRRRVRTVDDNEHE